MFRRLWFFLQEISFSSSKFKEQSLLFEYKFWNSFYFHIFCCKNNEIREFSLVFSGQYLLLIRQSVIFTPFFTPIPATSNFSSFGFSSEKKLTKNFEVLCNKFFALKASIICSYCVWKYYKPLILLFDLIKTKDVIFLLKRMKLLKQEWRGMQRLSFIDVPIYQDEQIL